VGSTIIAPGEETFIIVRSKMTRGRGGPHEFHVLLVTDDPVAPEQTLVFKADFQ